MEGGLEKLQPKEGEDGGFEEVDQFVELDESGEGDFDVGAASCH